MNVIQSRPHTKQCSPLRTVHHRKLALSLLYNNLNPGAFAPDDLIRRYERTQIANRKLRQLDIGAQRHVRALPGPLGDGDRHHQRIRARLVGAETAQSEANRPGWPADFHARRKLE